MKNNELQLLSAALRTIGGDFDIPTLDLILNVLEAVKTKGEAISIGDVKGISAQIAKKYELDKTKDQ